MKIIIIDISLIKTNLYIPCDKSMSMISSLFNDNSLHVFYVLHYVFYVLHYVLNVFNVFNGLEEIGLSIHRNQLIMYMTHHANYKTTY